MYTAIAHIRPQVNAHRHNHKRRRGIESLRPKQPPQQRHNTINNDVFSGSNALMNATSLIQVCVRRVRTQNAIVIICMELGKVKSGWWWCWRRRQRRRWWWWRVQSCLLCALKLRMVSLLYMWASYPWLKQAYSSLRVCVPNVLCVCDNMLSLWSLK